MSPPSIPESNMRELLKICTVEAPFKSIDGQLYKQRDGLAMGGPLSCTLANFYMAHIENQVLSNINIKPKIYARFVDDIFLVVRDEYHLIQLKNAFIANSKLNFTHEIGVDNKLPFLDVLLEATDSKYTRYVYSKPTSAEECIRYDCDAPERYKSGVIYTLMHRAKKICNTNESLHIEKARIKSLLVNNGFPNGMVDCILKKFRITPQVEPNQELQPTEGDNASQPPIYSNNTRQQDQSSDSSATNHIDVDELRVIRIFYRNQYHPNYKQDEEALKKIIKSHVLQVRVKIKLLIYYKSPKVSNLIMQNNLSKMRVPDSERSHLLYEFQCQEGQCSALNNSYIGMTACTLKSRLSRHRYQGAIFSHFHTAHKKNPDINTLLSFTKILYSCDHPILLPINY